MEAYPSRDTQTSTDYATASWLPLGIGMKCLDTFQTLYWCSVLGSSWCTIMPRLIWWEYAGSSLEGIDTTNWPPHLPDLNPTDHLWDIMFQTIQCHQIASQTVHSFSDVLIQIFQSHWKHALMLSGTHTSTWGSTRATQYHQTMRRPFIPNTLDLSVPLNFFEQSILYIFNVTFYSVILRFQ